MWADVGHSPRKTERMTEKQYNKIFADICEAKRKFQEIVENDETDNQDKWNSIEKLFKVKKFHPTYGSAWDFFAGDEIVGCADDTGDGVTFYLDASCHETFDDEWLND